MLRRSPGDGDACPAAGSRLAGTSSLLLQLVLSEKAAPTLRTLRPKITYPSGDYNMQYYLPPLLGL